MRPHPAATTQRLRKHASVKLRVFGCALTAGRTAAAAFVKNLLPLRAQVDNRPNRGLGDGAVGLFATRDIHPGDEILVDYGHGKRLGNEQLLLEFGFTVARLPGDALALPLGALAVGLEAAREDLEPPPEDDLEQLLAQQAALLGATSPSGGGASLMDDVNRGGLCFDAATGQPTPATWAAALVLAAQAPRDLAGCATPDELLQSSADAPSPEKGALRRRAAIALRAVALAALAQLPPSAAAAVFGSTATGTSFEASARVFCDTRRGALLRAAAVFDE